MIPEWLLGLLKTLDQPGVDELLVNGHRSIIRQIGQRAEWDPSPFQNPADLSRKMQEFAFSLGLRLDPFQPFASGSVPGFSIRWHAVIAPAVLDGPLFALRRHRFTELGLSDFAGTANDKLAIETLWCLKIPLFVCGPTGSGKTTLLSILLRDHSLGERVVFLEDTAEIPMQSPLWSSLTTRASAIDGRGAIPFQRLMEQCLRLRPDRIVVSEIRDSDSLIFLDVLNSGHGGSATTIHAADRTSLMNKLNLLCQSRYNGAASGDLATVLAGAHGIFLERDSPPRISEVIPLGQNFSSI